MYRDDLCQRELQTSGLAISILSVTIVEDKDLSMGGGMLRSMFSGIVTIIALVLKLS